MNDRYLFKAKRTDNGEWVIGSYVNCCYPNEEDKTGHFILEYLNKFHEIYTSTICQCTGLKDKNGKLIWENDIVRDKEGNCYKAFWQNNYYQFSWICVKSDIFQIGTKWDLYIWRSYEIEVIGNRFDNPELLESEEQ